MNTKKLREYITKNIKNRTDNNIDLDFIASEYIDKNSNHMHGFFNIMHSKADEEKYLRKELKLAKDSQVIYEFVQNARDAKSSEIFIYYNNEYFLVINNGNKFNEKDISSILDIGQSSKDISDDNIGSFGVGFKIVHRLVGSDDGLEEIVTKYNGPILFSWDNDGFKHFMNKQFEKLSLHWLFKILYTCFPCGLNERVLNKTFEKEIFFKQNEVEKIIQLIEAYPKITNFKNGSLFFLSLGSGKYELLKKEENELKKGLEYSLNLLDIDKKSNLSKITINDNVIEKKDMISLTLCDESVTLLFHKDYQKKLDFYKQKNSRISFYTYFPMSDQKENLNFVIHSSKFDYKTDRRQLSGKNNDVIIEEIANEFLKKLDIIKVQEQEKYISILQDLYLSSLSLGFNNINEGVEFLKNEILKYIKRNIPFVKTNSYGIDIFEITDDKTQVVIIDSKLDIPIKMKYNFYFSLEKYEDIVKEAESKLELTRWNIVKVLLFDDITKWILELDSSHYNILLKEIEKEKRNYSQAIINKWKGIFTFEEIKKILEIFKVLNKDKIQFTVIKIDKDKYEIIPNERNHYIKNKNFKEFLEQSYELCEMNIFLIPEEMEDDILSIIGNDTSSDKKIMNDLLECNQHRELINFVEFYELEEKFLDSLEQLELNTQDKYNHDTFEHKVIYMILKFTENIEFIDVIKKKILVNNSQVNNNMISRYINFKYGNVDLIKINNRDYKHLKHNNTVYDIIDSFIDLDRKQLNSSIFKSKELSKDEIYENIFEYLHRHSGTINSYAKLKFLVLYSIEQEKNFISHYKGWLLWDTKISNENLEKSFELLNTLLNQILNENDLKLFHISDFFPNNLDKEYYLLEDSLSIKDEKLPELLENKYIETFSRIGLSINKELAILRKKLLNCENIKRDDLIQFTDIQLINTLEFLSLQEKLYDFDSVDTTNLKTIFKQLKSSRIETLQLFPILKTKFSFVFQRLHQYLPKEYVTKESIISTNKVFQERLEKEIEQKDLIYLDILDLDNIPITWNKVVENEEEKKEEALGTNQKAINELHKKVHKTSDYNSITAEIGKLGELLVEKKLIEKFGPERVIYNNNEEESRKIDFEILDENLKDTIHYIEVKSTIKEAKENYNKDVAFYMSSQQYQKALKYDTDTHLIFVTGVETSNPEFLYMNFNNNWLESQRKSEDVNTIDFIPPKTHNKINNQLKEDNELYDEEDIINLSKFKNEKDNKVINKLGVIIRRLNKTRLNKQDIINFVNEINNPDNDLSEILKKINRLINE